MIHVEQCARLTGLRSSGAEGGIAGKNKDLVLVDEVRLKGK